LSLITASSCCPEISISNCRTRGTVALLQNAPPCAHMLGPSAMRICRKHPSPAPTDQNHTLDLCSTHDAILVSVLVNLAAFDPYSPEIATPQAEADLDSTPCQAQASGLGESTKLPVETFRSCLWSPLASRCTVHRQSTCCLPRDCTMWIVLAASCRWAERDQTWPSSSLCLCICCTLPSSGCQCLGDMEGGWGQLDAAGSSHGGGLPPS